MSGKAPTPAHRLVRDRGNQDRLPRISIDYFFVRGEPYLAVKDSRSRSIWAIAVDKKGSTASFGPERLADVIESMKYDKAILRSDQEPAIVDLQTEISKWRAENIVQTAKSVSGDFRTRLIPEHSGVGDSQSNGDVEEAIK